MASTEASRSEEKGLEEVEKQAQAREHEVEDRGP